MHLGLYTSVKNDHATTLLYGLGVKGRLPRRYLSSKFWINRLLLPAIPVYVENAAIVNAHVLVNCKYNVIAGCDT